MTTLSEDEKTRIRQEERFRRQVRLELEAEAEAEKTPPGGLVGVLANDSFRWVMTVLLLPLLGLCWGLFQNHLAKEEARLREELASKDRAQRESLAEVERKRNEELSHAQRNAELLVSLVPYLTDAEPKRQQVALVILGSLSTQQVLPREVEASLVGIVRQLEQSFSSNPSEDDRKKLELLAGTQARFGSRGTPQAALAPPSSGSGALAETTNRAALPISLPRIYIQIYDEPSRKAAEVLRGALRKAGFLVPGVENVSATALNEGRTAPQAFAKTTVVYFHDEDAELARRVVDQARAQGVALDVQPEKRALTRAPHNQIEVWLGTSSH